MEGTHRSFKKSCILFLKMKGAGYLPPVVNQGILEIPRLVQSITALLSVTSHNFVLLKTPQPLVTQNKKKSKWC